jgi:hypothetical protein
MVSVFICFFPFTPPPPKPPCFQFSLHSFYLPLHVLSPNITHLLFLYWFSYFSYVDSNTPYSPLGNACEALTALFLFFIAN